MSSAIAYFARLLLKSAQSRSVSRAAAPCPALPCPSNVRPAQGAVLPCSVSCTVSPCPATPMCALPNNDSCGMAVQRMGMSRVNAREMKALTMKMEAVTPISKGKKNLACFVY
jgi:hypothetical protein